MASDRILGNARGPYAWVMCLLVLALAVVSAVEWFRWGDVLFIVGAVVPGAVAIAGMVRLLRMRD